MGISSDSTQILNRFTKNSKIEFPLLSDSKGNTMNAFGVRNKGARGILPHPGFVIVDSNGMVKAKLFHEGYRKRHSPQQLIDHINSLKTR